MVSTSPWDQLNSKTLSLGLMVLPINHKMECLKWAKQCQEHSSGGPLEPQQHPKERWSPLWTLKRSDSELMPTTYNLEDLVRQTSPEKWVTVLMRCLALSFLKSKWFKIPDLMPLPGWESKPSTEQLSRHSKWFRSFRHKPKCSVMDRRLQLQDKMLRQRSNLFPSLHKIVRSVSEYQGLENTHQLWQKTLSLNIRSL